MAPVKDITGLVFGKLRVISQVGATNRQMFWLCECGCGTICTVRGGNLKNGHTTTCGCYGRHSRETHGHTKGGKVSSTYGIWATMIWRCHNPNSQSFYLYGQRGVTVCERWRSSFSNFLADMGERPKGLELDRIDNNGHYEPNNCHWVPRHENMMNRRNTAVLTVGNETHSVYEWSKKLGFSTGVLRYRIKQGWPPECVVGVPLWGRCPGMGT
jgi:hypothetical protein